MLNMGVKVWCSHVAFTCTWILSNRLFCLNMKKRRLGRSADVVPHRPPPPQARYATRPRVPNALSYLERAQFKLWRQAAVQKIVRNQMRCLMLCFICSVISN